MIRRTIRRGKKLPKGASRWDSGYIQPTGKLQKRRASKKSDVAKKLQMGMHIKKHGDHLNGVKSCL